MANPNGRKRPVSLADLSNALLDEIAAERCPPPEGAFTCYDVGHKFHGLGPKSILEILSHDKRLDSKLWRGKRYFWPRARA